MLESPELLTSIGFIEYTPFDFHSGKLSDFTKEKRRKAAREASQGARRPRQIRPGGLEGQELLSWQITARVFDDFLRSAEFEYSGYPVNQISGVTVNTPSFLTDQHQITNVKSVKRYISRLNEFGRVLDEVRARVADHRDHGVTPPDFVIEKSIAGMEAFIEGGAAEKSAGHDAAGSPEKKSTAFPKRKRRRSSTRRRRSSGTRSFPAMKE